VILHRSGGVEETGAGGDPHPLGVPFVQNHGRWSGPRAAAAADAGPPAGLSGALALRRGQAGRAA
jgi:hypothetical protein